MSAMARPPRALRGRGGDGRGDEGGRDGRGRHHVRAGVGPLGDVRWRRRRRGDLRAVQRHRDGGTAAARTGGVSRPGSSAAAAIPRVASSPKGHRAEARPRRPRGELARGQLRGRALQRGRVPHREGLPRRTRERVDAQGVGALQTPPALELRRPARPRGLRGEGQEHARELAHRGEAPQGVALQRAGQHLLQPDGRVGHQRPQRARRLGGHLQHQGGDVVGVVGGDPGDALEDDHRERPLVTLGDGVLRVRPLLRGHVLRRAEHRARGRERALLGLRAQLRDAEVQELGLDLPRQRLPEEDVVGLQVAVDDVALVHRRHRGAHREHEVQRGREGERAAVVDAVGEALPLEELHREVGHAVDGARVVDLDDVGVLEARRGLRLAEEARGERGVRGQLAAQDLQRHALLQRELQGLVDHPERARAEHALDLVGPECLSHRQGAVLMLHPTPRAPFEGHTLRPPTPPTGWPFVAHRWHIAARDVMSVRCPRLAQIRTPLTR